MGYGPVAGNNATEAENVESHTKPLGIGRLSFTHPARQQLDQWFLNTPARNRPTILITGTAGDGKTTLCYEIIKDLTGTAPAPASTEGIETFDLPQEGGHLDLIRDLTAWRKRDVTNKLIPEQVATLERIAAHAKSGSHYPTIIAVNDGQIHEVFRALPDSISDDLREFFEETIQLHSKGLNQSPALANFRLVDLSMITSEVLMRDCITAIISRPEWKCLEEETSDPLFAPESPLAANFQILSSEATQHRLCDLARLADACQFHLPIRSILMLLSNALLGHPAAPEGLIKPNAETRRLLKSGENRALAAFHRNLFGFNLGTIRRKKHNIYRFLASLQIGSETTNDIDELLIFGDRDQPEVKILHAAIVGHNPHHQRCKKFQDKISCYIRGEIHEPTDMNHFLDGLADERRRVFFHADDACIRDNNLWSIASFHHAGTYIHDYLVPLRDGRTIPGLKINPIITGLNRIWTGMYIASTEQELVLASGLDMTTSPISDILLDQLGKSSIKLEPSPSKLPKLVITRDNRRFEMILTLMRFEFIQRAAEGAMPGSFSREACEDLMSLKQKALRDLNIRARPNELFRLTIGEAGRVMKTHIQLDY